MKGAREGGRRHFTPKWISANFFKIVLTPATGAVVLSIWTGCPFEEEAMKAVIVMFLLSVSMQTQAAIDFNTEIETVSVEQYELNQQVLANGGGSEEMTIFEKTFKNPEVTQASISPVKMMKLRYKRVKLAAR